MMSIFHKEIAGYFNSLVGYLVIGVFLLISGLVVWVFPDTSVLEQAHATLSVFFRIAPYLLLLLIPAVTMRSFAGERVEGTLDWLQTKPLSDSAIVGGKFFGSLVIVLLALLPTGVYVLSLYLLASPTGNIDLGSIAGSYLGLLFLVCGFLAMGLAASAASPNPVVAFLTAAFACYLLYDGPAALAALPGAGSRSLWIEYLGMATHFEALARGVLDTRDLLYFASVSVFFLLITHALLSGRRRPAGCRTRILFGRFASVFALLFALQYAGSVFHGRVDFSRDQRYGLSDLTRATLRTIPGPVQITVLLDGPLPPTYQHLRQATADFLQDLKAAAPAGQLHIRFEDPTQGTEAERERRRQQLAEQGILPTSVRLRNRDGSITQQRIYPVASVGNDAHRMIVPLLKGQPGDSPEQTVHRSVENLEYAFISAIRKWGRGHPPVIGFTEGQGELGDAELHDAMFSLADAFQVGRIDLSAITLEGITQLDVLVIAKPRHPFSEAVKYKIDYFLMHGGSLIWAIDQLDGSLDSLRNAPNHVQTVRSHHLGLDDQLFTYGVRLRQDLLLDLNSHSIPTTAASATDRNREPGMEWMPWPLHPVLIPVSAHPVVHQLGGLLSTYSGTLDTLELEGVRKEILLQSSPFIRTVQPPVPIALSLVNDLPEAEALRTSPRPVVALLEGRFPTAFLNRPIPAELDSLQPEAVSERGQFARMVVMADGDLIRNQVNPRDGSPYPLGWDRYTGQQFANRQFFLNLIDYLTDDPALIGLRSKAVKLRLLDRLQIEGRQRDWQLLNVAAPLTLLLFCGGLHAYIRRKRYRSNLLN